MRYWANLHKKLYRVLVVDDASCEVMNDIIEFGNDRFDAADNKLTEFGFARTEDWDSGDCEFYVAEVAKIDKLT